MYTIEWTFKRTEHTVHKGDYTVSEKEDVKLFLQTFGRLYSPYLYRIPFSNNLSYWPWLMAWQAAVYIYRHQNPSSEVLDVWLEKVQTRANELLIGVSPYSLNITIENNEEVEDV